MLKRCCLLLLLLCSLPLQAAQRVISLAPSITEMVLDLGAQDVLVGMLDAAEKDIRLAHVTRLGRLGQLNIEQLIQLQPDLVLDWPGSLSAKQRHQLQQLGIELYSLNPRTMHALAEQYAHLGTMLGRAEQGAELKQQALDFLARLQETYQRPQELPVFYQLWDKPIYTLGGEQIISDALAYCGARNVFAGSSMPAPQVSMEAILAKQPEVIILAKAELARSWQQLGQVKLMVVSNRGIERPSWQMLPALEQLCQELARSAE